jgi:hypothetical protein
MLLSPGRTRRTGVICSASDRVVGITLSIATVSPRGRGRQQGRSCGAPWIDTATAQSIFQAEKITLGTAGSPAGFL